MQIRLYCIVLYIILCQSTYILYCLIVTHFIWYAVYNQKKPQKNKQHYSQHKDKINCTSKVNYEQNRERVIENSLIQQTKAALVNPDKAKASVRQRVMEYRQQNPGKSIEQLLVLVYLSIAKESQKRQEQPLDTVLQSIARESQKRQELPPD